MADRDIVLGVTVGVVAMLLLRKGGLSLSAGVGSTAGGGQGGSGGGSGAGAGSGGTVSQGGALAVLGGCCDGCNRAPMRPSPSPGPGDYTQGELDGPISPVILLNPTALGAPVGTLVPAWGYFYAGPGA